MMYIFVKPSFAFYIFVALNHFNIPNVDKDGGVCASVTTVVTAPLDSQRREGGRPSAIKLFSLQRDHNGSMITSRGGEWWSSLWFHDFIAAMGIHDN